jgi:hypothetical protein
MEVYMNTNHDKPASNSFSYTRYGMALGLIVGGFLGVLVGNPAIFAGGGLVLGLAVGRALDQRIKTNPPNKR